MYQSVAMLCLMICSIKTPKLAWLKRLNFSNLLEISGTLHYSYFFKAQTSPISFHFLLHPSSSHRLTENAGSSDMVILQLSSKCLNIIHLYLLELLSQFCLALNFKWILRSFLKHQKGLSGNPKIFVRLAKVLRGFHTSYNLTTFHLKEYLKVSFHIKHPKVF